MQLQVSADHVRRENRKAIYLILFLTVVCVGLVAKALSVDKISELFFPIIGLLFLAPPIFGNYKRIKEGKAVYPTLDLDEPNRKITVNHKDIKVIVDLSQINNLRLQSKSGQLVSILLKTSSGEDMRFEGYENLDALASSLERLAPPGSITSASFYHH